MSEKQVVKTTDEIASMFLGLVIVGALVMIIFNVFNRIKGRVDIPGITDQTQLQLSGEVKTEEEQKTTEKKSGVYIVKKGDSLWKLAQNKLGDGNRWVEIAKYNKLGNPSVLEVGQELVLEEQEQVNSSEYTIARGDSLWKIAVAHYSDGFQWTKIWENNKSIIANPSVLIIGTKIVLPGSTIDGK